MGAVAHWTLHAVHRSMALSHEAVATLPVVCFMQDDHDTVTMLLLWLLLWLLLFLLLLLLLLLTFAAFLQLAHKHA